MKKHACARSPWCMLLLTYVFVLFTGTVSEARPNPNLNPNNTINSAQPNDLRITKVQMEVWFRIHAPYVYFHPNEDYLPSSVDWFFNNGALLYKRGEEWKPVRVQPDGANLPLGGGDDGSYWLGLPTDKGAREWIKKGDLASAQVYVHVKPTPTYTDMQVWMFYPFNGHATADLGFIKKRVPLGKVGEHVGDWEHVTMRLNNFNGNLEKVYFAQHSGGIWVDASQLEYLPGTGKRFIWYASRNGHAGSNKEGLYLQGPGGGFGLRNDWAKSNKVLDTGVVGKFAVVSSEGEAEVVAEPPWLNYMSKWGPTREYNTRVEVQFLRALLPGKLKKALDAIIKLVDEVFGTDGPTGPKAKNSWRGDENH